MKFSNFASERKTYTAPSLMVVELESGSILISGSEEEGKTERYGVSTQSLDEDDWE